MSVLGFGVPLERVAPRPPKSLFLNEGELWRPKPGNDVQVDSRPWQSGGKGTCQSPPSSPRARRSFLDHLISVHGATRQQASAAVSDSDFISL
jgi:hypothetical protein